MATVTLRRALSARTQVGFEMKPLYSAVLFFFFFRFSLFFPFCVLTLSRISVCRNREYGGKISLTMRHLSPPSSGKGGRGKVPTRVYYYTPVNNERDPRFAASHVSGVVFSSPGPICGRSLGKGLSIWKDTARAPPPRSRGSTFVTTKKCAIAVRTRTVLYETNVSLVR